MELRTAGDLFLLSRGEIVSRRNFFDLVKYSKVAGSPYWSGPRGVVGNTPQQGIHWLGQWPDLGAAIIKTRTGAYADDGWIDKEQQLYRYSFKFRGGELYRSDKANQVLIQQPRYRYPILLFTSTKAGWCFEGSFSISDVGLSAVSLYRNRISIAVPPMETEDSLFREGGKKFIAHAMTERSRAAVQELKESRIWICDICREDYSKRYGVEYIEAHHKVPVSTYSEEADVRLSDLVLLCPNCHKAVHLYMVRTGQEYEAIKSMLRRAITTVHEP